MADYCSTEDVLAELKFGTSFSEADTALMARYITRASESWELTTGARYAQVTVADAVIGGGKVQWATDGTLRWLLPTVRPTAITAAAYRVGSPVAAWMPVPVERLDWDTEALRGAQQIAAYLDFRPTRPKPLWVRWSGTAGWAGTEDDPYPADIRAFVAWLAAWHWRQREAPEEVTANPQFGTITIPSKLPARLAAILAVWKRPTT